MKGHQMLRKILMSSVAIAGTSTIAVAGGLGELTFEQPTAPVMAATPFISPSDWTGFYVGGSFGTSYVEIGDAAGIDAANAGLHAGYMYEAGSYVLGGEIEYSRLDFDGVGDDFDASVLRLKVRVGYDAGAILPYFTAGAARLTLEDGSDANDTGYFYGIGADYAVTDNVLVGAEILQHEFEDFNGGGAEIAAQTMSLRVSYSF